MPRIAGVDIPAQKRIEISLTYIYGIGRSRAREVLSRAGIAPNVRTYELDDDQIANIRKAIENTCSVEGDLRREVRMHIKRLTDLGAYRGLRHRKSLPVRGQRTRTNARTAKGPRKTVAGRKKAPTAR